MGKRFLLRHLGNMGDAIFFLPPALEMLKSRFPDCHITLVTAWGFKDRRGRWGLRNQSGFCIALLMTNPHIDQLVHWHDTALSLEGTVCNEEGKSFPTWNRTHYEHQKKSGVYDEIFELDFGLRHNDNPIKQIYQAIGLPQEEYSHYKIYVTEEDRSIAHQTMQHAPHPRIVLLEELASTTTRGWNPNKIAALEQAIIKKYRVAPLWFGGSSIPEYRGRSLTLRENIATLTYCDVAIGVLSGPLHFAAAVGLPTITLYCDQPLHRTAPAYFLNKYIKDPTKRHRTLLGPTGKIQQFLKLEQPSINLTPREKVQQNFKNWLQPGKQATKSCLAVITVDEIMAVLQETLSPQLA